MPERQSGAGAVRFSRSSLVASVILFIGCVSALGTTHFAIQKMKVGGEIYQRIALGKDLVADILPPPEYIIEPLLEVTLALNDPKSVGARRERLAALRKDYDGRHDYWLKQSFDDAIRLRLTDDAHKSARRFWDLTEESFLPALARGDLDAARAAYKDLSASYDSHRAVIDDIVQRANNFVAKTEAEAGTTETSIMTLVFITSGLMVALVIACTVALIRGLIKPIARVTSAMG